MHQMLPSTRSEAPQRAAFPERTHTTMTATIRSPSPPRRTTVPVVHPVRMPGWFPWERPPRPNPIACYLTRLMASIPDLTKGSRS